MQIIGDSRAANVVTAYSFENAVGSVWHVAVVAFAAGGVGAVTRVRGELTRLIELLMALKAGGVAFAARGEHVIRLIVVP